MPHVTTAAEIIAKANEVYATCRSYRDEGERTSVMVGAHLPDGRETFGYRFRTAFVRPSDLFYDYCEFWRGTDKIRAQGVICAKAQGVEQWWSVQPVQQTSTTLSAAIAQFTGVAGGLARSVPLLLLPELGRSRALPDPHTAHIKGEADHEGRACFVIEGTRGRSSRPITVWIDRGSFLLRRSMNRVEFDAAAYEVSVQRLRDYVAVKRADVSRAALEARIDGLKENSSPGFATETTTTWRAEMNIDIERAVFEFKAPCDSSSSSPSACA